MSSPDHAEQGMSVNAKALAGAVKNYYQWNLDAFDIPKGIRILDIGCGPCLYLDAIAKLSPAIYLATDYSEQFLKTAREMMEGMPNFHADKLDILSSEPQEAVKGKSFDCILCFDVLEHLPDDVAALSNIRRTMLETQAQRLMLRLPAMPSIFGSNDKAIGHFRRYTKASLSKALKESGFKPLKMRYQNIAGVLPWFIIGRLRQRELAVSSGEGRLFDMAVPLLKLMESIVPPPLGLSVYCVAEPVKEGNEQ